ncbi:MAG: GtrA family protein [Actinomycetota bacterium]|nr:GtrA family protein [Actinomycetota bacterium]
MSENQSLLNEFRADGKYVKAFRYVVTSGVSVAVAQVTLFILYGVFRKFSATSSNVIATGVSAVPAYYMNRNWAWGKSGKSHFWKEVFPFWALAFLGLAVSMVTVAFADRFAKSHNFSHLGAALAVNLASLFAFGILWIGKFFIFNKFMFSGADSKELEAA